MSVKKRKSKKEPPKPQPATAEIDYEKLAHAIANALIEADSIRKEQSEKEEQQIKERLREIRGEKECPQNAGWLTAYLYQVRNDFVLLRNMCRLPKKDAEHLSGATVFVQSLLETIFSVLEGALYIVAVVAVAFIALSFVQQKARYAALSLLLCAVCLMYARYFRLARFEVEYMKDKNYMASLLSAISSFFAMLFALIGLLGGIIHGT